MVPCNHRPTRSSTMTLSGEERFDVFLGGSCGGRKSPTSWRKEVAIPLLLKNKIKFYNPQVETWSSDLVHKENDAKDKSDWLLFVLEMTTRGIASMIEIAYLVGLGRSVVFVLQKDRKHGRIKIPDDRISSEEASDIVQSQILLAEMVGLHAACKLCSVLKSGLKHVIRSLKQAANGSDAQRWEHSRKVTLGVHPRINKSSVSAVFRKILTSFSLAGQERQAQHRNRRSRVIPAMQPPRFPGNILPAIIKPVTTWSLTCCIVGIIGNIPWTMQQKLKDRGLRILQDSSFNSATSNSLTPDLAAQLSSCGVLLIIVPFDTLACSVMCKAAYYLSQHRNSVACVQDITEKSALCDMDITPNALRDYNRGRAYLRDIAERQGAFVCQDLGKAMEQVYLRAAAFSSSSPQP